MTARKPKSPALPPVLPLVAIPYVSPGQIARLDNCDYAGVAARHFWNLADEVIELFAADTVAAQCVAIDGLRATALLLINERPIDDPRGAPVAAPAPDHVPGVGTMVSDPAALAGMTARETFDAIAGELGFVRAEPDQPPVCATCHAAARDFCACDADGCGDACQWCGCSVESGQRVCAPCAAASVADQLSADAAAWLRKPHGGGGDGDAGTGVAT